MDLESTANFWQYKISFFFTFTLNIHKIDAVGLIYNTQEVEMQMFKLNKGNL